MRNYPIIPLLKNLVNEIPERGSWAESISTLYIETGLSLRAVAARVGLSHETVRSRLVRAGVQLRPRGGALRPKAKTSQNTEDRRRRKKHSVLSTLSVGDSVLLPRSSKRLKWQCNFYMMAARIGIRVSVRRVDNETAVVTRIG
jgi:IS30 family transposase